MRAAESRASIGGIHAMNGIASLLFGLGLVGIGFALMSFVAMLLSGAPFSSDLGWIGGNAAVGIALLASAAALNFDGLRERLSSAEAKRAGKYGTSAALSTVAGIVILGLLGFVAARNPVKFDWSEQKVHTLSDQTQKTLAGLEDDVEVLVLVNKIDAGAAARVLRPLRLPERPLPGGLRGPERAPRTARGARHHGGAARRRGAASSR